MVAVSQFCLAAAYHQIYLFDDEKCPLYPENIEDADLQNRLKCVPYLVAVYTASDDDVDVAVELFSIRPEAELTSWLHVVEGSLMVPSGRLVISTPWSYLPDCDRINMPPGAYRIRVSGRGFRNAERENYRVDLWPASSADNDVVVLKSAGPYAA
jgi:hypothetical protein